MLMVPMSKRMKLVEMETDVINTRTTLTTHAYDLSLIGMFIKNIKYLMYMDFSEVKVLFPPRSCRVSIRSWCYNDLTG
jgi:hypothetical protein